MSHVQSGKGILELKKLPMTTIVKLNLYKNTGYKTPVELRKACHCLTRDEALEYIREDRKERSNVVYEFEVLTKEKDISSKLTMIEHKEELLQSQIEILQADLKLSQDLKIAIKKENKAD